MNFTKYRLHFLLLLATIVPTLLIWFAFYFNLPRFIGFPDTKLETVFANYDGPNYMIVSKCWYNKHCIGTNFSLPQPLEYYPAHLPGFPLLIKYFSLYTTTPKGMLLATFVGSILLTLVSFAFFKMFLKEKTAFWLTLFSVFFPARLFVLRLVGAPETWFISFLLLSVMFFQKKKFFISSLFGVLAMTLKSPAALLFAAYGLMFFIEFFKNKKINFRYAYYLLIPITALGIFYFYYLTTGDFWAYFHTGDNIHLTPLPYEVFVSNRTWVNTIWLEDVLYIFFAAFIGVYLLFKKYKNTVIFYFPLLFTIAAIFVAHRDISRYLSPAFPFLILGFAEYIDRKPVRWFLLLLMPAIILYAINFIVGNTAPIANWAPYL